VTPVDDQPRHRPRSTSAATGRQRRQHPTCSSPNLYGDHVFAFQLTSVLLIVAVAGTVLITRKWPKRRRVPERRPRAATHDRRHRTVLVPPARRAAVRIGAFGLLVRRNPLIMFMCIELMLNAANLAFVAFATASATSTGRPPCSS
jgi:hypothetical protein